MPQPGLDLVGLTTLASYLAIMGVLSLYGVHRWFLLWFARDRHSEPAPPTALPAPIPWVTVQLPIYNERFVVARLLRAACGLDWPRDRLEIQILDDSTDDTSRRVARLAARARRHGFTIRHLQRAHRSGFKAGALAHGLHSARGRFIAIFDADFVPPPHFLRATLPHFTDPAVGLVQARWGHLNRRASWLTRIQAIFLDGHFHVDHVARARSGCFFNFNGTAGVWRRTCIEDAGGWQADTLTEDMDLSYRAQMRGWRFVYRHDVVAPAELPARLSAFRSQQHRWAKGSIQTARKLLPGLLASTLPWKVRLEATFHLTENIAYLCLAGLTLLIWPALRARQQIDSSLWLFADLPVLGVAWLSVVAFYFVSQRREGRSRVESMLSIPPLMSVGVGLALNNATAVVEALIGRTSPFVRTPKDGSSAHPARWSRRAPRRYEATHRRWPILEASLCAYLTAALVDIVLHRQWFWLPFLALFLAGYAHTTVSGLAEELARRRQARREFRQEDRLRDAKAGPETRLPTS